MDGNRVAIERPVISEIIRNFFTLHYANSSESVQSGVQSICKRIASEINKQSPPEPYRGGSYDDEYARVFDRWKQINQYPAGTQNVKKIDIFGKHYFRRVFHSIKDILNSTYLFNIPDGDFWSLLEEELYNDDSLVFLTNFDANIPSAGSVQNASGVIEYNKKRRRAGEHTTSSDGDDEGEGDRGNTTSNLGKYEQQQHASERSTTAATTITKRSAAIAKQPKQQRVYHRDRVMGVQNRLVDDREEQVDIDDNVADKTIVPVLTPTTTPSSVDYNDDEEELDIVETVDDAHDASLSLSPKAPRVTIIQADNPESMLGPDTTYASMSRDEIAKREEDKGKLGFVTVTNDGSIDSLKKLLALKNIFSMQLPKMPKDYIVRLVFDKNHHSMAGVKNGRVVGGICYRPFYDRGFAEIAFLAIIGNEQVKGYGTRLMNHLKEHLQSERIYRYLTYADNYAIGYFKKQGFTQRVTMPEEVYKDYIKHYDGGTLMECIVHHRVNYVDVPGMIKLQRKAVYEKLKQVSNSHIIYKGLDVFKGFQPGQKVLEIEDIPGVKEAGYGIKLPRSYNYSKRDLELLTEKLRGVLHLVSNHQDAWPFLEPVSREEVPDYYDIIKDPIDLGTISKRLSTGMFYRTKEMFAADMRRVFDNCRLYNREDTEYYHCANSLEAFFKEQMRIAFQGSSTSSSSSSASSSTTKGI
eukprot:GEZU01015136.1.p1 GENE.GEZU01015136.1~~GEZU01015136.1.p1  ORF type:complete len:694 (-),score=154.12 GEZU01015136.1:260-2341(-)